VRRRHGDERLREELAEVEERLLPVWRGIGADDVVEHAEKLLDNLRAGRAVHGLSAGLVGMPWATAYASTLTCDDELIPEERPESAVSVEERNAAITRGDAHRPLAGCLDGDGALYRRVHRMAARLGALFHRDHLRTQERAARRFPFVGSSPDDVASRRP
jgi:hypothetical protein